MGTEEVKLELVHIVLASNICIQSNVKVYNICIIYVILIVTFYSSYSAISFSCGLHVLVHLVFIQYTAQHEALPYPLYSIHKKFNKITRD